MRTTLSIDDDVLDAARALARRDNKTVGEVVSALARAALAPGRPEAERNGLPLLSRALPGIRVDDETVRALADDLS